MVNNNVLYTANKDVSGLKAYSLFLRDNFFQQASEEYIKLLELEKVPLLQHFAGLAREEYTTMLRDSLLLMLNQLCEGKAFDGARANIDLWKNNQYPGVPRHLVQVTDFVKVYSVRKQLLIQMLPLFSKETKVFTTIFTELEKLYIDIQEYAFGAYVEVQKALLQEQKDFGDSLIDTSPSCLLAFDKNLSITAWNKSFTEEFRILKEQALSKHILEVLPFLKQYKPLLLKALQGVSSTQINVPLLHRKGICEMHITPQFNAAGALLGGVLTLQDVSHLKEVEQKLKEYQEELEVSNEELKEGQQQLEEINEELNTQVNNLVLSQKALEESENKYRLLADNSSDLISILNLEGCFMYVSPSCKNLLGYTVDELTGTDVYELYHPDDRERVRSLHQQLMVSRDTQVVQFRLRNKQEEYLWFESTHKALPDPVTGTVSRVQVASRNITANKQVEMGLVESQRFIQRIAEATPDVIFVLNLKTQETIYSNRSVFTLLGYSATEVSLIDDAFCTQKLHKDDVALKERFLSNLAAATHNKVYELRLRMWHKHGFWSTFLIRASVFRRSINGEVAEIIGLVQDISKQVYSEQQLLQKNDELARAYKELKEKEEILRELNSKLELKVSERTRAFEESALRAQDSEKQLRLITNALPALVSYIDKDLRYRFVNLGYQEWFGIDANTIIGERVEDVIGRKAFEKLKPHILKVLSGQMDHYEGEVMYKMRGTRYINVQYIPDFDNEGQVKGYIALILDMSENIKARRELAEKNKQLTKINIDLDNFIYTASHDLKAPIANLEGLISALTKKLAAKADNTEDTLLQMIEASVDKFKKTIDDLTEITKAQKAVNEQTDFLLFEDIMQDVLVDIEPLIEEAGGVIHLDFKVPGVKYARKNLRSILYNLVSNAIKYRSPDRKVEVHISTVPVNGYILLSVQDNGLGIDPGQQHKLFTMFKRLHSHVEGTGIGLYIIKRIIDNNGGFIELDSQPDKGSIFKVYFKYEED